MSKKYFDTKENTLESSILGVWKTAAEMREEGFDGRTSDYKSHRAKLEAARVRRENKKLTKEEADLDEGTKEEYEKFFNSALKKFKIDSPADLKSDEEKKKFFNYIDKNYKGEKDEAYDAFMKEMFNEDMFTEEETALFELDDEMFEAQMKKKSAGDRMKAKKKRDKYMKTAAGKASAKKAKKRAAKVRSGAIKVDPKRAKAAKKRAKLYSGDELGEGFGVGEDVPAMEVGTDRYRDYALNVTPGETDPEWVAARDFKVASMKEALAKVWGLDEKKHDKTYDEEDEELKPVEGSKTMTGGKVAKVDTKPKIVG